jgi:hypothetical protein
VFVRLDGWLGLWVFARRRDLPGASLRCWSKDIRNLALLARCDADAWFFFILKVGRSVRCPRKIVGIVTILLSLLDLVEHPFDNLCGSSTTPSCGAPLLLSLYLVNFLLSLLQLFPSQQFRHPLQFLLWLQFLLPVALFGLLDLLGALPAAISPGRLFGCSRGGG